MRKIVTVSVRYRYGIFTVSSRKIAVKSPFSYAILRGVVRYPVRTYSQIPRGVVRHLAYLRTVSVRYLYGI